MTRPVFVALVAALAATLLLGTAAAQATHPSGDRFLLGDGTLSATNGSPQACLQLTATGANSASKTWMGLLDNTTYDFSAQTAAVTVAYAAGSNAGTGFRLDGRLTLQDNLTADATKSYGSGASLDTPATLTFDLPAAKALTGGAELVLTLTKTGTGLPLAQSVTIQCGNADSRLHSLLLEDSERAIVTPEDGGGSDGGGLSIPLILAIAVGAGLITMVAGALVLAGRTISQRRIHFLLGFTAGLLIAIAMLDLIPEALELTEAAPYTIVIGLLILFTVRHFAGGEHDHTGGGHDHGEHEHHGHGHAGHGHEEAHDEHGHEKVATHAAGLALIAFFALGFHRFVDGLVLPAAFELDSAVGIAAASAVLIHQFPDGIAAASLFLAAGWRRKKVLLGIAIMAVLTPIGSVIGLTLLGESALVGHLIALAAATFIFIALAELLPELRARDQRVPVGLGFGIGYLVAFLIVFIPGLLGIQV